MRPNQTKIALTVIIATVIAVSHGRSLLVRAAQSEPIENDLRPVVIELHSSMPSLLAWASNLSGYPLPEQVPRIYYRPRTFFVTQVCGGNACKAVGWYNDQNVIYLDEKYRYKDQDDFANSLLLHELVHFLQHVSGKFDSLSCVDSLAREREAYAVQNDYLANVWYSFRFIAPKPVSCAYGTPQK